MTINWFGHSCFRIESRSDSALGSSSNANEGSGQVSILIDPFSKEVGLRPPKIKDDIILTTHNHFDHNNLEGANPEAFIINSPGEYEKQGVYIRGINSFHDKSEGKERGLNTIYVIKSEDILVCHLGDLGQEKLNDKQLEDIGDIDILMVPVGGTYTINYKEAVAVIGQIEPKIVIPMHYKLPNLKIDLEGVEKFVKELGLSPEKVDKFKISKKTLPAEEMKLIVFE